MKKNLFIVSILGLFIFSACGGNELLIPKPSTYLRSELPEAKYRKTDVPVPYHFEINEAYYAKQAVVGSIITPHLEVSLGKLNGTLYLSYYPLPNRDSLVRYINLSNDKVNEHQIKAKGILDENYLFPYKKVYGTFFELQGDVATNFQFYLTDSVKHFIRGEVLMNSAPKYDSLRPSLAYIKKDIQHLIKTFEWK